MTYSVDKDPLQKTKTKQSERVYSLQCLYGACCRTVRNLIMITNKWFYVNVVMILVVQFE